MRSPTSPRSLFCVALTCALLTAGAGATWVLPNEMPVERLIKGAQAYIDAKPSDPRGYFVMGRIHSYAYALNTTELLAAFSDADAGKLLPNVSTNPQIQTGPRKDAEKKRPTDEQRLKHLTESITNYRKAAELHATSGMSRLGLAYVLDVGARESAKVGLPPGDKPAEPTAAQKKQFEVNVKGLSHADEKLRKDAEEDLAASITQAISLVAPLRESKSEQVKAAADRLIEAYWRECAIKEYQQAYDFALKEDAKRIPSIKSEWDLWGVVSYEAAQGYVKLVGARGARPAEKAKLGQMAAYVKRLKEKSEFEFAVTPIIFALDEARPLAEMLAPNRTARFDLDGNGVVENWPWVKATTGFLVWDPRGKGEITSGRQMFGSVTWWVFWRDGYHALDALDENRDGELRGGELEGLAVWFDRDGDGVSDAGEVAPVGSLNIEALATSATGDAGDANRSPANPRGLRMKDGRVLPTYDWIVAPAPGK